MLPCCIRFNIKVADADGTPYSAHFFRARFSGPAIVMGEVEERADGEYLVTWRPREPGLYTATVSCLGHVQWVNVLFHQILLLHASGSGIADPGQGIPRFFVNQHIYGSPFNVLVDDDEEGQRMVEKVEEVEEEEVNVREDEGGRGKQPQGLCKGRASAADPYLWGGGRWVRRDVCQWHGDYCGGIESQRFDQHDDDG